MGNICIKAQQQPTQENQTQLSTRFKSQIPQRNNSEIINDIKQFLNLNQSNTTNLYEQKLLLNQVNITHFQIQSQLGRGAFGRVFLVTYTKTGQLYAMKVINRMQIKNKKLFTQNITQRYILEAINHPFLIKLYFAFKSQTKFYLIFQLMKVDLFSVVQKTNITEEETVARFIAAQILLALQYLHSKNIIYRDLKPQNIMIDIQGHIKLIDFGVAKVLQPQKQRAYSICGSMTYMAPEVLKGKGYTNMCDWFSFGSVLYCMLNGRPPFFDVHPMELHNKKFKKPQIPKNISIQAKSILEGLLQINPQKRLGSKGVAEIKKHNFFKSINFEEILQKKVNPPIILKKQQNFKKIFEDRRSTIRLTLLRNSTFKNNSEYNYYRNISNIDQKEKTQQQGIVSHESKQVSN